MGDNSFVGCRISEQPVGAAELAALRPQRCPTLGNPPRPVGEFSIQPGRGRKTHPDCSLRADLGHFSPISPPPFGSALHRDPSHVPRGMETLLLPVALRPRVAASRRCHLNEGGTVWGFGALLDRQCRLPPLTGPDSHRGMIHEPTSIRPARNSGRTGAGREREQARKAGAERSGAMPVLASGLGSEEGCCEDDDGERVAPAEASECWLMGIKAGSGRTPTSVGTSLISAEPR